MPVSGSISGSAPGERSAAFCRVRCLLSYPKEFYVLFFAVSGLVRSRVSDGLSERFGFAASRSGAGAVVVGGRTGGPALRFPARGFSLYRPSNVKNQVRAFFAIRRRMEMYGYRPESLRSLVRKLLG